MKVLVVLAKVLVSSVLFYLAYIGFSHGSSSGFDLGIAFGLFAVFHLMFWGNK